MSTYDDASLILIPSGVKAGKVYSAKPTSGDGDFTFTRASEATRLVDGVVTKVRTNSIESQNFVSGAYGHSNIGVTVTSGVTDPDGGTKAYNLTDFETANNRWDINTTANATSGEVWCYSAYYKGTGSIRINISTTTGTGGSTEEDITLTSSWVRHSVFVAYTATSGSVKCHAAITRTAGNTASVDIAFPQIERGTAPSNYIATTTVAVSEGPVANMPRLNSVAGGCPSLLLEPQRTNLVTQSEYFDNAAWNKTSYPVTITANQTASPTGYVDADLITPTAALSRHAVGQTTISATSGVVYTISAFFKKAVSQYVVLTDGGDSDWHIVTADLDSGTITNQTNATGTITSYANGWYRVTCTFTRVNTSFIFLYVGASNVSNATALPSFNDVTLTTYVWGCQSEASAAYATSYIPTYGTAATRVVDACYKTGISSLIGQTEGTLFYDGFFGNEATEVYLFLQNGASSGVDDSIYLQRATNAIALNVFTGATQQSFISGGTFTIGQRVKIAAAYKANDFVLYVNGVQLGTDNTGSVPTCDALQFASYRGLPTNAEYINVKGSNQALLFKTRLTNAELATLTTL